MVEKCTRLGWQADGPTATALANRFCPRAVVTTATKTRTRNVTFDIEVPPWSFVFYVISARSGGEGTHSTASANDTLQDAPYIVLFWSPILHGLRPREHAKPSDRASVIPRTCLLRREPRAGSDCIIILRL